MRSALCSSRRGQRPRLYGSCILSHETFLSRQWNLGRPSEPLPPRPAIWHCWSEATFVRFRGRQRAHPEIAMKVLRKVAEGVASVAKLEKPPGMEGRVLSILLAPSAQQKGRDRQEKPATVATAAPASNGAGDLANSAAPTGGPDTSEQTE